MGNSNRFGPAWQVDLAAGAAVSAAFDTMYAAAQAGLGSGDAVSAAIEAANAATAGLTVGSAIDSLCSLGSAVTLDPVGDAIRDLSSCTVPDALARAAMVDSVGDAIREVSDGMLAANVASAGLAATADAGVGRAIAMATDSLQVVSDRGQLGKLARAAHAAEFVTAREPSRPNADGDRASAPTVLVFVRLTGNDRDERALMFKIPEGVDPMDLLESGFAIDGNQAAASVHPDPDGDDPFAGPFVGGRTLMDGLRKNQIALVEFLRERGFSVRFA